MHYGIPFLYLGALIGVGLSLIMCIGVYIFGISNLQDSMILNMNTSMHPQSVEDFNMIIAPIRTKALGKSWNLHSRILYSNKVAFDIGEFIDNIIDSDTCL